MFTVCSFGSAFPKNRCCLTKFHKIHGNSSRRTYSSRVSVGILLQLTTTVTGLRLICLLKTSLLPIISQSRCGLPDIFLSYNGPSQKMDTSQKFFNFAKTYVSSWLPGRRIMLKLLVKLKLPLRRPRRCLKKSNLLTVLLDHRNTPPQGTTYFPVQRFLCRRTKSNLQISESMLNQSVPPVTVVRDEHLVRRAKAKAHYDKTAS